MIFAVWVIPWLGYHHVNQPFYMVIPSQAAQVLKLLSQQESTVEDDEKFQEAELGYVLLGR